MMLLKTSPPPLIHLLVFAIVVPNHCLHAFTTIVKTTTTTSQISLQHDATRASTFSHASSINEDGDFVIQGINDEYMSSSSSSEISSIQSGQYLSNLLDSAVNNYDGARTSDYEQQQYGDRTSSTGDECDASPSSNSESSSAELFGLTEDGDFLMSGINADLSEEELSDLSSIQPDRNRNNNMMTNPFADMLNKPLLGSSMMPPTTITAAGTQQIICEEDEEVIGVVEEFLSTILPSHPHDCARYAEIFVTELGFDPDCESSQELTYEDLEFMKKLHARHFWKEWTNLTT